MGLSTFCCLSFERGDQCVKIWTPLLFWARFFVLIVLLARTVLPSAHARCFKAHTSMWTCFSGLGEVGGLCLAANCRLHGCIGIRSQGLFRGISTTVAGTASTDLACGGCANLAAGACACRKHVCACSSIDSYCHICRAQLQPTAAATLLSSIVPATSQRVSRYWRQWFGVACGWFLLCARRRRQLQKSKKRSSRASSPSGTC